jgi:2-polyprenyl-6-methoxyphenol hydroxylase-like FAD-dependent oxidoreductase
MSKSNAADVVIVGAGIGGLAAALSLHAVGIEAIVIDSVRKIRPLGLGINLQPHAVRELIELGFGDDLAAIAVPTAETVYFDRFGNRIFAEPRGRAAGFRWPQYSVHRGELQMMLLSAVYERLGKGAVRVGTRLEGFQQTLAAVRAHVINRTAEAVEEIEAAALIGADGLHSTVRSQLHPAEGSLLWSGVRMWRGMTESESFLTGQSMIIAHDGRGTRLVAYPVSPRATEHGRALINWVCLVSMSEPGPLAGDANWNRVARPDDLVPYYADWKLGWLDVPRLIRGSAEVLDYPMVDRNPLPRWGHGRVTLLGDAAHPMYPVGANGASQAILDAGVLAHELAMTHDPIAGLISYENSRRETTAAIVQANRSMDDAERIAARRLPDDLSRAGAFAAITDSYRRSTTAHLDLLHTRDGSMALVR